MRGDWARTVGIEVATVGDPTGELVTEALDYDGGRQVTVYVPSAAPEAVVFAADGQAIAAWAGSLEAAYAPTTMIISVHGLIDEMPRLHEYSPVFDTQRFAAHEKFFVDDVRRWARSRFGITLPTGRTAVFGYSAGGELALALGLRHPDVYGAVFAGSPGGGYRPPAVLPSPLPRVYLFAAGADTARPSELGPGPYRQVCCRASGRARLPGHRVRNSYRPCRPKPIKPSPRSLRSAERPFRRPSACGNGIRSCNQDYDAG